MLMSDGINEMPTKSKINLYKAISQAIIKKYYANKNEVKFDNYLKDAIKNLKKINLIETRSNVELERYHNTTYPGFLWQEKINQKLHFFASMIGFIDGIIDNCTREINFYSHFEDSNSKNEITKYKENQENFLKIRNNILIDFTKRKTNSDPTILITTLETIPSHQCFSELYNDSIINEYQLNLQQELVNAYNVGYTSYCYYGLNEILNLYNTLNLELTNYEELNQQVLKKEQEKKLHKTISQ